MTDALRVESQRLASENPSFRAHSLDFEFLWGSESMLSTPNLPNLAQFYRWYPKVRDTAVQHDRALVELREACAAAFKAVLALQQFRTLCPDVTESERGSLAEYIVDGMGELPDYYVLHRQWNSARLRLLGLRSTPELTVVFERVTRAVASLREAVQRMGAKVESLQQELADEYGLPVVDPSAATPE